MIFRELRILVLEDQPFQRSVAASLLRQLGCVEVFLASDGVDALDILSVYGPMDIALCDLRMEGLDGLGFLQGASREGLLDSVIICSALPSELRGIVQQIVPELGLKFLGDVGKPLLSTNLKPLLEKYMKTVGQEPVLLPPIELANEEEVRRAMAAGQLRAYYQPKFDLKTGEVSSVEVLARWHHPEKGTLAPAVFLPAMERSGLMDTLLFDQIDQGLSLQRCARERGHKLNIAFNLQAEQLESKSLLPKLRQVLKCHMAAATSLTFELTESGLLEHSVTSLENLLRLRMMGCRLSIDDFGTGFSSLLRFCHLPFSEIKLDAAFIRAHTQGSRCLEAISSTLNLGKALGVTVVAEGIETEEQRQILLRLGCLQGQGYLCARPMKGDDLLLWLDDRQSQVVGL